MTDKILEALKGVLYFPEGDNIVALNMVQDLKVEGEKVSFSIVFTKPDEKNMPVLRQTCEKTIQNIIPKAEVIIDFKTFSPSLKDIKHIIAIASGKGGVGKSTIAANLAVALSKTGASVGIIDADIYGPSIPLMFNVEKDKPMATDADGKTRILPVENYGIKIQSVGFFVDPEQALIWRGPMASNALSQLFNDTVWGELDYLIVDLPPGTGDVHLTLAQTVPVEGIVVVSTPQEVALADARKAFSMFNAGSINVPILGLVENMSYFTPEELPENKYYLFGKHGGRKLAEDQKVNLLGEIPLVQGIRESGDDGHPAALKDGSPEQSAFIKLAENIRSLVEKG